MGGGGGGAYKPAKICAPVLKERMCAMLMDNNIAGWVWVWFKCVCAAVRWKNPPASSIF